MIIGFSIEVLGYVAKPLCIYPFSDLGCNVNVVLLTFPPAFYATDIYATLAQICLALCAWTQSSASTVAHANLYFMWGC